MAATGDRRKDIVLSVVDLLLYPAVKLFLSFASSPERRETPSKVLVIDAGLLGDTAVSLPALKAMRDAWPGAIIHVVANPRYRFLIDATSCCDVLIPYEIPYLRYSPPVGLADVREYSRTVGRLRKERYDLAVDFRGDMRNILFFLVASGAGRRAGFGNTGLSYALTDDAFAPDVPGLCEAERNLRIARALGCGGAGEYPHVGIAEDDLVFARSMIPERTAGKGPWAVGFQFQAGYPEKRRSGRFWSMLGNALSGAGWRIVLLGSEPDAEERAIVDGMENAPLSLVGKTTVPQLAAVLSRLDLVVGVDSGPMHLAAALDVPAITVFGPTDPVRWGPYGKRARSVKGRADLGDEDLVDDVVREIGSLGLGTADREGRGLDDLPEDETRK